MLYAIEVFIKFVKHLSLLIFPRVRKYKKVEKDTSSDMPATVKYNFGERYPRTGPSMASNPAEGFPSNQSLFFSWPRAPPFPLMGNEKDGQEGANNGGKGGRKGEQELRV